MISKIGRKSTFRYFRPFFQQIDKCHFAESILRPEKSIPKMTFVDLRRLLGVYKASENLKTGG